MLFQKKTFVEKVEKGLKIGTSFGITSGVITTLGLLVGLSTSTQSKTAVISGILVIAIADAMSDSLGVHISQEAQHAKDTKNLWSSAVSTFISKFVTALTFVIPVLFLDLFLAVLISGVWGLLLLSVLSFFIAKSQREVVYKVILEHVSIAVIVSLLSAGVGELISSYFS